MTSNVSKVIELLKICSPEDKKQILDILIYDAQISVQHDTMSTCKTEENEKTEPLSFDNLVSYHDSLIITNS